jgi:hypothetical protein
MARLLQQRGVAESLRPALLCAAWCTRGSNAAVERKHATHRRLCHKQMPWHVFAALAQGAAFREHLLAEHAMRDTIAQRERQPSVARPVEAGADARGDGDQKRNSHTRP